MKKDIDTWDAYRESELAWLRPRLTSLGYTLDENQPHIAGERYLMQAVTTAAGRKLILLASRSSDGQRAVVKATSDVGGKKEIGHERACRRFLADIDFAYQPFHSPAELLWEERDDRLIFIQEYIEQSSAFLARPPEEQFHIALAALKAQESAHATTYGHRAKVRGVFGSHGVNDYFSSVKHFFACVVSAFPSYEERLSRAESLLKAGKRRIDQYGGFLTHTDFVPHNFRIKDGTLYLLDHSSFRFANKYEGWARFTNFMALYHPALASALVAYVRNNRTPEEAEAFQLMRIYRLMEILCYYVRTLSRSEGDLRALNEARIAFWGEVLDAVMDGSEVAPETVVEYQATRDRLRSPEEKVRQQGLH
ncbi:MAG: hypothetical protein KBC38_01585 [Candidatus Pacebacteria bacterium]|nr:hypothetical protein [Candidatus Paceibacterota bacterium]MBP9840734.1 hypothetical protein [Candidatus Paceibacterota bacterium]